MPEYHQVQVFVDLQRQSLAQVLPIIETALDQIGCLTPTTRHLVRSLVWPDTAESLVFVSDYDFPEGLLTLANQSLVVRPLIMGWAPEVYPALKNRWLELELLFESESLEDVSAFPAVSYRVGMIRAIASVMAQFAYPLPTEAVFLTNELQDGRAWEGQIEGDAQKRWDFELALIRPSLAQLYHPVPSTHQAIANPALNLYDFALLARQSVWQDDGSVV